MTEIVRCEICDKKMAKKPEYTVEKRDGQICNECFQKLIREEMDIGQEKVDRNPYKKSDKKSKQYKGM